MIFLWILKRYLGASIFRFYNDFVKLLNHHPDKEKNLEQKHPFIKHINYACLKTNVSQTVFKEWCFDVETGFYKRNIVALTVKLIHEKLGSSF